jgi:hypothetical protein
MYVPYLSTGNYLSIVLSIYSNAHTHLSIYRYLSIYRHAHQQNATMPEGEKEVTHIGGDAITLARSNAFLVVRIEHGAVDEFEEIVFHVCEVLLI